MEKETMNFSCDASAVSARGKITGDGKDARLRLEIELGGYWDELEVVQEEDRMVLKVSGEWEIRELADMLHTMAYGDSYARTENPI